MLKLSAKEQERLVTHAGNIRQAIAEANAEMETAAQRAREILAEVEEDRETAWGIMDDAFQAAEEYYDGKSEKWQEGERGCAYCGWKDELQRLGDEMSEALELADPEEIEEPGWVGELESCDFAEFSE